MQTIPTHAISDSRVQKRVQKTKFTDRFIAALSQEGYHWDLLLPGFGIYKGKNRVTFIAIRRGHRKKIGLWPHTSLADARDTARRYLASLDPTAPSRPQISYVDAVTEYLRQHPGRPRTIQEYDRLLNRFPIPKPLLYITIQDILKRTDTLQHTPTERLHLHAAMRAFFNWCVPRYLATSPMAGLKTPQKPVSRDRLITDDEMKRIYKTATKIGFPFGTICIIMIHTGMRRTEAGSLKWSYITNETIVLPSHLMKNRREHIIPNFIQKKLAHIPKTSEYLFTSSSGSAYKDFDNQLELLRKQSSVKDFRLHDFRRYFSSTLSSLAIPIDITETLLSHVSGTRTQIQRIYDRYDRLKEKQQALRAYEDHLKKLLS